MVGSTQWSTGTLNNLGVRNYQIVADTMNAANDADLQTFVDAIRVNNRTLMRAHGRFLRRPTAPDVPRHRGHVVRGEPDVVLVLRAHPTRCTR
jgi:hypothetical protein